jgi:hypothetical protein
LDTLVLVLFIIAWAAIIFAIVRAILAAWGVYRRLAIGTAVAVAGAFALGATSPLVLSSRPALVAASGPAPIAPVTPVAPVADTSRTTTCPAQTAVATKTTAGHLDSVAVGSAAATAPGASVFAPAGKPVQLGGWIVLDEGPPSTICAILDGRTVAASSRYGIDRPDVATALGKPADAPSGFVVTVRLPHGTHTVAVGAVEPDGHTVEAIVGGSLRVVVQ